MTLDKFNQLYGADWDILKKSPMWIAAISVSHEVGPQNMAHKLPLDTITNSPAAFLGSISGYSLFRDLFSTQMGAQSTAEEPEPQFSVNDLERFTALHPLPANEQPASKPKKGKK